MGGSSEAKRSNKEEISDFPLSFDLYLVCRRLEELMRSERLIQSCELRWVYDLAEFTHLRALEVERRYQDGTT